MSLRAFVCLGASLAVMWGSAGCAGPSGEFTRAAYRRTTTDTGTPAIRFESDFRIRNARSEQIVYEVTLHDQSGRPIRSENTRYQNRAGHIASGKSLLAQGGKAEYPNVGVNLPISEIERLRSDARPELARFSVYDVQGNLLAQRDLDIRLPATELATSGTTASPNAQLPPTNPPTTGAATTSPPPDATLQVTRTRSGTTDPKTSRPPTTTGPPTRVAPPPPSPAAGTLAATTATGRAAPPGTAPNSMTGAVTSTGTSTINSTTNSNMTGGSSAAPAPTSRPAAQDSATNRQPAWWSDAETRDRRPASPGSPGPSTAAPNSPAETGRTAMADAGRMPPAGAARDGTTTPQATTAADTTRGAGVSRAPSTARPASIAGDNESLTRSRAPGPPMGNTATAPPGEFSRGTLSDNMGNTGVRMIPSQIVRADATPTQRTGTSAAESPSRSRTNPNVAPPNVSPSAAPSANSAAASDAAAALSRSYMVRKGDTLSEISQRELGSSRRWREIYELNRDRMRSPETLRDGTELRLPEK